MARNTLLALVTIVSTGVCATAALGQNAPPKADAQVASQPASAGQEKLVFEVVEVHGRVRVASVGTDPKFKAGWTQAKVGQVIGAGQQVFTSLRGRVKLAARPAKPPTVILIEGATRIGVDDAAIKGGIAYTRLDLNYGKIKAGVAEGQVRSDMEIKCPVATLSKRGTDIFEFSYGNGRFKMALSMHGRGMLQAIQSKRGSSGQLLGTRSRLVTPGQRVTQRMLLAVDNARFDRNVQITDLFGLSMNDQLFTLLNDRGFGFLFPQGSSLVNVRGTQTGPQGADLLGGAQSGGSLTTPQGNAGRQGQRHGDFGIGQGLLPGAFGGDASRAARAERKRQWIHRLRGSHKKHGGRK